jgi:hypothetical protein
MTEIIFHPGEELDAGDLNNAIAESVLNASNGSVSSPGFTFAQAPSTGLIVDANTGNLSVVVAGLDVADFNTQGNLVIKGTLQAANFNSAGLGATGPTGPTGSANLTIGPTGQIGGQGPTGRTGNASVITGPTGPLGTGPTGPASIITGPTGPLGTGPTGSGATGPTGPIGSSGGNVMLQVFQISNANMQTLNTHPVLLIPSQGANVLTMPISIMYRVSIGTVGSTTETNTGLYTAAPGTYAPPTYGLIDIGGANGAFDNLINSGYSGNISAGSTDFAVGFGGFNYVSDDQANVNQDILLWSPHANMTGVTATAQICVAWVNWHLW